MDLEKFVSQEMKKIIISIIGVVLLLATLAFVQTDFVKGRSKKEVFTQEKLLVPAFVLPNLKGGKVHFSEFQGKIVILDFWATWCAPCREEMVHLNELYQQYKGDGLIVVGIAMDQGGPERIQQVIEKFGIGYINLMADEKVIKDFESLPGMGPIQGIPASYIIDPQGRICYRFVGLTQKEVFEKAIKRLMKKET